MKYALLTRSLIFLCSQFFHSSDIASSSLVGLLKYNFLYSIGKDVYYVRVRPSLTAFLLVFMEVWILIWNFCTILWSIFILRCLCYGRRAYFNAIVILTLFLAPISDPRSIKRSNICVRLSLAAYINGVIPEIYHKEKNRKED